MDIKNASFSGSQVNESVKGGASVAATIVGPHSGGGAQFNGCQFNVGPGWEVATDAVDATINSVQELILQGKLAMGRALLEELLKMDAIGNIAKKTQVLAAAVYCDICMQMGVPAEALAWLTSLPGELREERVLIAWRGWLKFATGDSSGLEDLENIQKVYPESPTILTLSIFAGGALREKAVKVLQSWLSAGDYSDIDTYRVPLLHYSNALATSGEYEAALEYLALIQPKSDIEDYKLEYMRLEFIAQEITAKPNISNLDHIPVEDWNNICDLSQAVDTVITRAREIGHDFHQAYALKSLLCSLLHRYEEAINVVPVDSFSVIDEVALKNIANNYQVLDDWAGLENFILNLDPINRRLLSDHHFIALINQGKYGLAKELEGVAEGLNAVLDEVQGDNEKEIELGAIKDVALAVQIARNRFLRSDDSHSLDFLKSLDPTGLQDRFLLAEALVVCGCEGEALGIYEPIFADLGAGIGSHFTFFLKILNERGRRALVSEYIDQLPQKLIYSVPGLTQFYIYFLQVLRGRKAVFDELSGLVEALDDLWLKSVWIRSASNIASKDEILERIRHWGYKPSGRLEDRADYLSLAAKYSSDPEVRSELYRLFHSNSRNLSVQRACFNAFFLSTLHDAGEGHEPPENVSSACAVTLGGQTLLIDDSLRGSPSPHYLLSGDESVANLIGRRRGDEVEYLSEVVVITEIQDRETWLARYVIGELAKRPVTNSIWKYESSTPEAGVEKILEQVRSQAEDARAQLAAAVDGQAPILCRLQGFSERFFESWIDVLYSKYSATLEQSVDLSEGNRLKISSAKCIVLGPCSGSSLALCPHSLNRLVSSSLQFAMPATVSEGFRASGDMRPKSEGRLGWDFALNKAVLSEAGGDEFRAYEQITLVLDAGGIAEVAALPNGDIPRLSLQLIQLLDPPTRDAMFSCYGFSDRVLASDDPWVRRLANSIGIKSVSSLELVMLAVQSPAEDHVLHKEFIS